ncbi:MAG TPA: P1 family peptidase [Rhizomicrobium sp.]|jgi:L-aminopeptidase/D-esterase-like protein|nr:P1 family peptidase [Rhizomicrobium sp.]
MVRPGARNLITDVAGLRVGNAADDKIRTGVTVLLADTALNAVADVRGGAPGSRELEVLDPANLVGQADAIVLAGGSVHGLDAASGVTEGLRALGRGFRMTAEAPPAPIVPAAILFDLVNGGDKDWGAASPYRALGHAALGSAAADFPLGNVGAGLGARAGAYKGGLGSASSVTDDGFTIGALVAVNALGSPLIPGSDVFWAFPFEQAKEFGGRRLAGEVSGDLDLPADMKAALRPGTSTTIAIVALDADVSRIELKRIAIMAADGFARALRPVHTPFDGDIVFAVTTAARPVAEPRARTLMRLGSIAADTLSRAIARGVYEARTLGAMTSYRDTLR